MRKLFLMIANSKDKKEKLIKSLQENELLGTDEKKKIMDQVKTMHDFFKQMHTNKGALDKVLRNYMKDYRAVIKSIGIDNLKRFIVCLRMRLWNCCMRLRRILISYSPNLIDQFLEYFCPSSASPSCLR